MKRFFLRGLSLLCVLTMCLTGLTACGNKQIQGTGGTAITAPEDNTYDFASSWITDRKALELVDDGWRVGTMGGTSVKITAGSTKGIGAWYAKEVADAFILHTTVSFANLKEAEASGSILLGADKDHAALTLTVSRSEKGMVTVSLLEKEKTLCTTGEVKTAEQQFTVILDNSAGDGKLRLHVTGGETFSYHVETDALAEDTRSQLKVLAFSSQNKSLVFTDLALDVMIYKKGDLKAYGRKAMEGMLKNFWDGDPADGCFINCSDTMVWEYGMALLGMETLYNATKDDAIAEYFKGQWAAMQGRFTEEQLTRPGREPNTACDDAAWTAMTLMSIYRMTGDQNALRLAGKTVERSYDYWKDEDISNGLWYRLDGQGQLGEFGYAKSVYCAGLILTALEYHEQTKGTDLANPELYADTLTLYNWVENNLRRDGTKTFGEISVSVDDKLYWTDFDDNRSTGVAQPQGASAPDNIGEAGSVSSLFGNMAMSVINAKLYKMQGDKDCLTKALETANALANAPYNAKGIFLNDRDAWTNAAFAGYFVRDVLGLEGIDSTLKDMVKNTALTIVLNCETADGTYTAEWNGTKAWTIAGSTADQIMTTASSAHMIFAGALAESLGYLDTKN